MTATVLSAPQQTERKIDSRRESVRVAAALELARNVPDKNRLGAIQKINDIEVLPKSLDSSEAMWGMKLWR